MAGAHSAGHVSALLRYLPSDCALRSVRDEDAQWTLEAVLMAGILNSLNGLIYGMGDKRKRGRKPTPVGPSAWRPRRKVETRAMTREELMERLNRPRS